MDRHGGAGFGFQPFNGQDGVRRDAVLLAAGADNCIGHGDAPKLFLNRVWPAFTKGKNRPPRAQSARPEEAGL